MHAQDDIALGKSWGVTVYNYAMCLRAATAKAKAKAEAEDGITRL